ncbi:MAG: heme ABC exporter ATP-binding protein CcmA [Myxococcota bacterium]|jgi:heme ABC exporter ATP-binding subunit CcmA|nr:heme ABC exporter ATP-binding protein CcmA [bacterium]MDP6074027.1 heme ABC exporter ATP-binding protein CcmA [Myxococcota bacterium]MDP6244174.1 heme ABC exporter ATP-binding protein CcmA [Myxococcota bacterium]MDP7073452.1 heme ABC exporter ATP-binding protein CcmA [Myxococcota bacterium]MDP7300035.1 heme ABC exporter ATP-binding protein CcmA [Myxococcota bacterium]
MTGAGVSCRGLSKRFGRAVALDGLDLSLAPGASLAVVGPNGAGKSTLLRLLAGLTRPSAGQLEVDGTAAHLREARARVGYIGHATLLYSELTARENLVFAARLHGVEEPGCRADALLDEEALGHVADERVQALSRGMAQRVAIARGLIHSPALVLLDEPFSGLDRAAGQRLTQRLQRLRTTGRSVALVTHDLARAAELADASLVLSRGRVVHTGRGEDAADLERSYLAAVDSTA